MDQIDPGSAAKTPPKPPRRPLFFYVMILASVSMVLGTVLLSNDMRHLRRLLKAVDQEWLIAGIPPAATTQIEPAPKRAAEAPKTIALQHPQLLRQPEPNVATALRRIWQMTGPDMCRRLQKAGADMSPWQAAAIGADIFECSYEKIYVRDGERPVSSLFVIVRGDARGRITSMRAKLVSPPKSADGKLDPALASLFETMLTQSRWGDFDSELDAIRSFRDIRKEGFGASMSFAREISDKKSFNFLLTLKATTAEQRRLNDLFRADNGFDLPSDLASPSASAQSAGTGLGMPLTGPALPLPGSVPVNRRAKPSRPPPEQGLLPNSTAEPGSGMVFTLDTPPRGDDRMKQPNLPRRAAER